MNIFNQMMPQHGLHRATLWREFIYLRTWNIDFLRKNICCNSYSTLQVNDCWRQQKIHLLLKLEYIPS